jgi:hypothetical protein
MEHDNNNHSIRPRHHQNTSRVRHGSGNRQHNTRGRQTNNVEQQRSNGHSRRKRHGRGYFMQTSARHNTSMANSASNSSDTSSGMSALVTTDASAPSTMPNIPGYYYDTERKRYFRIINTHVSGGRMPPSYEAMRKKQRLELEVMTSYLWNI